MHRVPLNLQPSAFSLIEVLIALLILSVGVMGVNALLVKSLERQHFNQAQALVYDTTEAVIESIATDKNGRTIPFVQKYWQNKLDEINLDATLKIDFNIEQDLCIYTVTLQRKKNPHSALIVKKVVSVSS